MKPTGPDGVIDVASVVEFFPVYHPDAVRAEVRSLFFLAGWREHAAPGFTLTLVCIDAPPPSVCWLAEQVGARLVECAPYVRTDGQVFNRARAWEPIPGEARRRLVLDPEVLVVGQPSNGLDALPAGTVLAAAPAKKSQVPEGWWPAIYRAVDLPMPTERLRSLRGELNLPLGGQGEEMPPFYHSAALLTPCGGGNFGELWARHAARLAAAWPALNAGQRADPATVEKAALATAVWATREGWDGGGLACAPLPRAWDGRGVYLEAGVPLGGMALLHLPGLFRELTYLAQIEMWLHACAMRWRGRCSTRRSRR